MSIINYKLLPWIFLIQIALAHETTSICGSLTESETYRLKKTEEIIIQKQALKWVYTAAGPDKELCGYVKLTFSINVEGKPTKIRVVESNPPRKFTRQAIFVLSKFQFEPKIGTDYFYIFRLENPLFLDCTVSKG